MSLYHAGQSVLLRNGAALYDQNGVVTSSVTHNDASPSAIVWGDYITLPTGIYAYPVVTDLAWFAAFQRGVVSPAPIEYIASQDVSVPDVPAATTANAFVDTSATSSSSSDGSAYAALIAQANAQGLGQSAPQADPTALLVVLAVAGLALVLYFRQK